MQVRGNGDFLHPSPDNVRPNASTCNHGIDIIRGFGGYKVSAGPDALIITSIQESIKIKQALLEDKHLLSQIADVVKELVSALSHGHKILLFGNGGSAADAQHIAAEFVGRFQMERTPLPALALTVNTSELTGIGNDYGFENVFSRQVEALGSAGDVAVGISTSGKSPNVLKALATAKAKGLVTVALTGKFGNKLQEVSRYCLCVPSDETPRIQESHILIGHIISQITEMELFAK
jgi:D-sedoheptulose 7-phosphate isomerase